MKCITLALCAFFIVGCYTVKAQTEAEMKNWMEYMTPGDVHKMIASWNGIWDGEVTTWMTPGGDPVSNTASTTNTMVMGGRYQSSTYTGSFSGMPFEGMSLLGYDNARKLFELAWIDNMGTGIMHLQGPWDPAAKTITLTGKMIDPSTGKETIMKEVFKIIDSDHHVMEMYGPGPDGKEFVTMQIKLTRKK